MIITFYHEVKTWMSFFFIDKNSFNATPWALKEMDYLYNIEAWAHHLKWFSSILISGKRKKVNQKNDEIMENIVF